ncbi:hypothetical protein KSW81_000193 [Nannochloris sp. 'desiccata']|nr:hypothetical protein KSW81_000193 [Chlorella desiccata (nom. nud.)]
MQVPSLTIDKAALKKGFWGNTWRNWGYIFLAFTVLYAILSGFFTGLLFASKGIRQKDYKTLPNQYYGDFERENVPVIYPYPEADSQVPFNRPNDCVDITEDITIPLIDDTVPRSTGVQRCTPSKDVLGWVLFPWVSDTQAAGNFPGCDNAGGATILTQETSPAFVSDGNAAVAPPTAACQNFVISPDRPDLSLELDGAAAPGP